MSVTTVNDVKTAARPAGAQAEGAITQKSINDDVMRLITKPAAERIVRFAFELARNRGRRMVTFCHKADVMRLSDGLFLECARAVADDFPFIQFEEKTIDNVCMELAMNPSDYDVLVMENLFGDVISDLAAGLIGPAGPSGGLGLVPGANFGPQSFGVSGGRPILRRV